MDVANEGSWGSWVDLDVVEKIDYWKGCSKKSRKPD